MCICSSWPLPPRPPASCHTHLTVSQSLRMLAQVPGTCCFLPPTCPSQASVPGSSSGPPPPRGQPCFPSAIWAGCFPPLWAPVSPLSPGWWLQDSDPPGVPLPNSMLDVARVFGASVQTERKPIWHLPKPGGFCRPSSPPEAGAPPVPAPPAAPPACRYGSA